MSEAARTKAELRALLQAATNESKSFNGFAQWTAFSGYGTILNNDCDEQRNIIKYNYLVANCVIFHNVFSLSQVLHILQKEAYPLSAEHCSRHSRVAAISFALRSRDATASRNVQSAMFPIGTQSNNNQ